MILSKCYLGDFSINFVWLKLTILTFFDRYLICKWKSKIKSLFELTPAVFLKFSISQFLIKVPYKCSRHRVKQIKIIALGLFFSRVYYKTFRRIFQNGARHRGVWLTAAGLVSSLKPRFFPPGRAPSGLKMLPSLQSRVECSFSYYIHISTLYLDRHI